MVVIERIPKSIVYHRIHDLIVVHTVTKTSLLQCVRSHRHVFHTSSYDDISISCLDHLCRHVHTVQTRTTNNVYRNSWCLDRKSCIDRSLTCHILAKSCLDNTSHIYVIHFVFWNTSPFQSFLDHDGSKLLSRSRAECTTHCSNRRTACTC